MGSFNVACSISSISIGSGTRVAFIPLLPSEMRETIAKKYKKFNLNPGYIFLEPSSNVISNDGPHEFYKPFSLPIFAEYDDYGGIENVEENITSRALEQYFGISVDILVKCIGTQRGIYDYFSSIFDAYFELDKKLLSDYSTKFNDKWLLNFGFKKNGKLFNFKNHKFSVSLIRIKGDKEKNIEPGIGYEILDKSGNVLIKNTRVYDMRKEFLYEYSNLANYYIGYSEDNQEKIKLIMRFSGVFVHRDIYDMMANSSFSEYSHGSDAGSWGNSSFIDRKSLDKLGFVFRCKDDSIDRYNLIYEYPGVSEYVVQSDGSFSHISKVSPEHPNGEPTQNYNIVEYGVYHPVDLIKAWKELSGVEIYVDDKQLKESVFGPIFDELREKYLKFIEGGDEDEYTRLIKKRISEKLNLIENNKNELQKEIDDVKADNLRLNYYMIGLRENAGVDDDEEFDVTDEQLGDYIISSLKEPYVSFMRDNPLNNSDNELPLGPRYDKYNMLLTLYESNFLDGSIRQDIIDYSNFYSNAFAMNKIIMPALNGYQNGCPSATLALARKTAELMEAEISQDEYEE